MTQPEINTRPPLPSPPQNGPPKSSGPPPPPRADFRTATIENHWNDPPKKIFHNKSADEQLESLDTKNIEEVLNSNLELCKKMFENGPQKRVVDDTDRRLQELMKRLQASDLTTVAVKSLSDISSALEAKDFNSALKLHTQLMTTDYDKNGSWLVGLKRLIDLSEKACSA